MEGRFGQPLREAVGVVGERNREGKEGEGCVVQEEANVARLGRHDVEGVGHGRG